MLIVWSTVLGILIFLGIVVVTLLFGASAHKAEREAILRTQRDREAGLTGDIASNPTHPAHARYVNP